MHNAWKNSTIVPKPYYVYVTSVSFCFRMQAVPSQQSEPVDNWTEHSLQTGASSATLDSGLGSDPREYLLNALQVLNHKYAEKHRQNEMDSLQEEQSTVISETLGHVTSQYNSRMASLQQSLLQAENSIHALESQLTEVQASKEAAIEELLRKQTNICEELLQERDQKHAAHIARLTDEFQQQQQEASSQLARGEPDEQEAERLRLLKEKMRDLHEGEKREIEARHESEKTRLRSEFQSWADTTREQMEAAANKKIQEMHSQFLAAHQSLSEQKTATEESLNGLQERLVHTEQRVKALELEKGDVERQYHTLLESHSAEMASMQRNHSSLERAVDEWKDKAAKLELRLEHSATEHTSVEQLHRESEEAEQRLRDEHEQQLRALREELRRSQGELQQAVACRESEIASLQSRHSQELEHLKSSHQGEISQLQENLSDMSTSRSSLEVAEEHMSKLQLELEKYRTEEQNFASQLSRLQEEHMRDIVALKQQHERDKIEAVENVSAGFESQIESQEIELRLLQGLVEASKVQSSEAGELVETLTAHHRKALQELQSSLERSKSEELLAQQQALQSAHARALDDAKEAHGRELQTLREELEREWSARSAAAQEEVRTEQETLRDEEVERLKVEYEQELRRVRQTLESASRTEDRVSELDAQMEALQKQNSRLEGTRKDLLSQLELARRQIQELEANCSQVDAEKTGWEEQQHTLQDKVKSLEVDLDIARSAIEQDRTSLQAAGEECSKWKNVAESLQARVGELESFKEARTDDELLDQLAENKRVIAELQSHNDDLNSKVFSLTQQFQEKAQEAASLKAQLSSDTQTLQRQLQEKISSFEGTVHEKDSEITKVRARLEYVNQQLADLETHWSDKYKEAVAASSQKVEMLAQQVERSTASESELQGLLEKYNGNVEQLQQELEAAKTAQVVSSEECAEARSQLQVAREEHARALDEKEQESGRHIQSLQCQLTEKESALAEARREFEHRLAEAQSRESSLLQSLERSSRTEEHLGAVMGEKSSLEETLSVARQTLSEKLREKAALDRELASHKLELERRLAEKQRLEELLFEKARFEQELRGQKEQLQSELSEIESQLHARDQQLVSLSSTHQRELGELERGLRAEHGEAAERLQATHAKEVN